MARKIQFNIIQSLFRLFSFLADKTGGWMVFVKPKILLGSIILGFTACSSITAKQKSDTIKVEILPTDTYDSALEVEMCYIPAPEIIMCYVPIQPEEEEIKVVAEKMPEFPGGVDAMMRFFYENLRFPVIACYESGMTQGRVIASFVVEKDGSISNIEVLRGFDPSFDREAVRLIQLMPKWTPGEQQGETVRVKYTLPVTFRLQ